jgi:hypothetical protein
MISHSVSVFDHKIEQSNCTERRMISEIVPMLGDLRLASHLAEIADFAILGNH